MRRKITLVFLAFMGIIALSGIPQIAGVFADELTDDGWEYTDRGYLLVSPNRLRYGTLEPGSNYTETFMAYNIGDQPISFKLSAEPFWVEDETYAPIYSEATNRTKISNWITFPNATEYTLAPRNQEGDRVEITVRVKVPSDAVGGGQYAAVMANIIPPDADANSFQARSRIALPLYSTINGDVIYRGKIVNRSISGFSFAPIIRTSSTIENTGNADFEAKYHLLIKSFFGSKTAYDDTQEKIILPETKRIFEHSWEDAPALGIFNVTQEITYVNENGEQVTDSYKRVTILCPLWLILVILTIVVLAVIAITYQKKSRNIKHKKSSWEQG